MLLSCCENENNVCRRFFKCFQKGVECRRRQHMHLIDDENFILPHLRWYASLVHQGLDVLDRIITCGIEFEDVVRPLFIKCPATLAMIASLSVFGGYQAVDSLGKNTGTSGLTYASGAAEKISVRQLTTRYCILQSRRQSRLTDNSVERHRAIFARRNNVFVHIEMNFSRQKYVKKSRISILFPTFATINQSE